MDTSFVKTALIKQLFSICALQLQGLRPFNDYFYKEARRSQKVHI